MPQDIITHFSEHDGDSQAEEVITYVQAVLSRSTLECEEIPDALRDIPGMEDPELLREPAELALAEAVEAAYDQTGHALAHGDYVDALAQ